MSPEALDPHVRNPSLDLFDFDDLLRDAAAHAEPEAGAPASPLPRRKPATPRAPAPAAEAPQEGTADEPPAPPRDALPPIVVQAPAVTVPPATIVVQAPPRDGRSQWLLAGAFVFVNLVFAAVCWRSMSAVQTLVADGARGRETAEAPLPVELPAPAAVPPPEPVVDAALPPVVEPLPPAEGPELLALALQALEQGRFDLARQRLFGVLAVIDRYEPSVREDLEARASFLLGDCWRQEAGVAARAQSVAAGALESSRESWR